MSKKDTESLFDEILKNARADRARLEQFLDGASQIVKDNPEVSGALAENMTKTVEVLTKVNAQLVEVAKTRVKENMLERGKKGFDDQELDEVFDEIDDEQN